jgi:hypothetical protein
MFSLDRDPTLAPTRTPYLFPRPIPIPNQARSIRCQRPRRSIERILIAFSYLRGIVTIV